MRAVQLASLQELATPLRGLRVLLFGFSGQGFPGGDGAREAVDVLGQVGVRTVYTYDGDPDRSEKLAAGYDVGIVTNTRIGMLVAAGDQVWDAAERTAWWFWDLRPGIVGSPLRGRADRVFLSYSGDWKAPNGDTYSPSQWADAVGCPVSYCPQGTSLREPIRGTDGDRVLFVGDLANPTYHRGRAVLCKALSARVLNMKDRTKRLAVEAMLPTLYRSSRYVLSTSPKAPGYTSVRTYSILACGGLMLVEYFPGAEKLFRNGEHAIFFDSAEELKAQLAILDEREDERQRIADAGRELHARTHTVAHRVLSICREMAGVSEGFSGFLC